MVASTVVCPSFEGSLCNTHSRHFHRFESEQASGIILMVCTLAAIVIANSPFGQVCGLLASQSGCRNGAIHLQYSLEHWINDGLMAIFFLLIGLEIERELYVA